MSLFKQSTIVCPCCSVEFIWEERRNEFEELFDQIDLLGESPLIDMEHPEVDSSYCPKCMRSHLDMEGL